VLVNEISVATNERVSFTRSGYVEVGKEGRKKKKCDVCVYDLTSVLTQVHDWPALRLPCSAPACAAALHYKQPNYTRYTPPSIAPMVVKAATFHQRFGGATLFVERFRTVVDCDVL